MLRWVLRTMALGMVLVGLGAGVAAPESSPASVPEASRPGERPRTPAEAPTPAVTYKDDTLTVRAKGAPVGAVLDALAKAVPLEVRGHVPPGREVTLDITDVPTQEAVERILGNQNFTLRYGDKGLEGLELKGDKEEAARPPAPEPPTNPPSASAYAPDGWWKMTALFAGKRVPITGHLAKLVGDDSASWDQIIQSFILDETADRVAAVRAGLKAFEGDPELRDAVMRATEGMPPDKVAVFVRAFCRDLSLRYLRMIVRYAHDDELRARVSAVAREIRAMEARGEPLPIGKLPPRGQRH